MDDTSTKIVTLVVLIILTLVFGCAPYFLVLRGTRSMLSTRIRDTVFACLNCFAGGVFLGTLLLHLMIEGAEEFEAYKDHVKWDTSFPYFNTFVVGGFFFVGLMEHFMNSCLHHNHSHNHSHGDQQSTSEDREQLLPHNSEESSQQRRRDYGSISPQKDTQSTFEKTQGLPEVTFSNSTEVQVHVHTPNRAHVHIHNPGMKVQGAHIHVHEQQQNSLTASQTDCSISAEHHAHSHSQSHSHSHSNSHSTEYAYQPKILQAFLLLMALSFHTIFDGLAVGLQKDQNEVWGVFAAISIHKIIIAFCLGFEMFKSYIGTPWRAFLWMAFFSIMSPVGILIGMILTSSNVDEDAKSLSSSILQGVAAGVFLYVTFLEILCSYMGHSCVRGSKFIYYFFTAVGFSVMAVVKVINPED